MLWSVTLSLQVELTVGAALLLGAIGWRQQFSPWWLVLPALFVSVVAFGLFELAVGCRDDSSSAVFLTAVYAAVALSAAGAFIAFFTARMAALGTGIAVGFGTILVLIAAIGRCLD